MPNVAERSNYKGKETLGNRLTPASQHHYPQFAPLHFDPLPIPVIEGGIRIVFARTNKAMSFPYHKLGW